MAKGRAVINLLIAAGAGLVVTLAIKLAHLSLVWAIIPGTLVFLAAYLLLARRIAQKVQALVNQAQKELSTAPTSVKDRQQKVDRAVKTLEGGLPYGQWQFLIASEIHAQIGMLKYMMRDFEGATPHLNEANARNYMARALLGALAYQKKDFAKMREHFESAAKAGRKEPIVWAAYAWCLNQLKENDEALKVMARGVDANPNDDKLKAGMTALQNNKKLKMKAYEPLWWQFGLEQPPPEFSGGRQVRFQRR
jgi:tetratricopeptide (TPR) repeat protein